MRGPPFPPLPPFRAVDSVQLAVARQFCRRLHVPSSVAYCQPPFVSFLRSTSPPSPAPFPYGAFAPRDFLFLGRSFVAPRWTFLFEARHPTTAVPAVVKFGFQRATWLGAGPLPFSFAEGGSAGWTMIFLLIPRRLSFDEASRGLCWRKRNEVNALTCEP